MSCLQILQGHVARPLAAQLTHSVGHSVISSSAECALALVAVIPFLAASLLHQGDSATTVEVYPACPHLRFHIVILYMWMLCSLSHWSSPRTLGILLLSHVGGGPDGELSNSAQLATLPQAFAA
eukprot:5719099-Amphidinium_carterae.1